MPRTRRRRYEGDRVFGHPAAGSWFAHLDDGRDLNGAAAAVGPWRQGDEGGIGEEALIAMIDAERAAARASPNVIAVDFVRRRCLR